MAYGHPGPVLRSSALLVGKNTNGLRAARIGVQPGAAWLCTEPRQLAGGQLENREAAAHRLVLWAVQLSIGAMAEQGLVQNSVHHFRRIRIRRDHAANPHGYSDLFRETRKRLPGFEEIWNVDCGNIVR
jgi:hypothetical protein